MDKREATKSFDSDVNACNAHDSISSSKRRIMKLYAAIERYD